VGVALVQNLGDFRPDAFWIAQHLMIPETEDAIALGFDHLRAAGVPLQPMLTAVDFDDEPRAVAREIRGESAKRDLKSESRLSEALAQKSPHRLLRFRRIGAEPTCTHRCTLGGAISHVQRSTTNATPTQP
jgi:hypothetical protein